MAPAIRGTGSRSADRPGAAASHGRPRAPADVTSLASTTAQGQSRRPLHGAMPPMVEGWLGPAAHCAFLVDQDPVLPDHDYSAWRRRHLPDRPFHSARGARADRVRDGAAPGGSPPCVRTPGLWSAFHPDEATEVVRSRLREPSSRPEVAQGSSRRGAPPASSELPETTATAR
jgi:hypothetical protein